MPTYQYRCTECGEDLEAVQKFSDAALTECPRCGGPLRKLFNAVGVVFKGSGFYRTDSRVSTSTSPEGDGSKQEKKTAEAGKEVAAKANENGSATSDKAPASSPATNASATGSGSEGRSTKVGATAR